MHSPMRQAVAGQSIVDLLERVTRIELVTEAWEAFMIPFHHTRITGFQIAKRAGGVNCSKWRVVANRCW